VQSVAKLFVFAIFAAGAVLADGTPPVVKARPETALPPDILTNEGVVLLSDAGFSDSFVAVKIHLSRTRFDTSAEGLAYLRRHSISEELVKFIMEYTAKPVLDASAPQTPLMVPMKVVTQKVLVPIQEPPPAAAMSFAQGPAPAAAVRARRGWWPWSRTHWYGPSPTATGYGHSQGPYATPAKPILQSPAFPANAPIPTPAGSPAN
jgi:hypothetical protein